MCNNNSNSDSANDDEGHRQESQDSVSDRHPSSSSHSHHLDSSSGDIELRSSSSSVRSLSHASRNISTASGRSAGNDGFLHRQSVDSDLSHEHDDERNDSRDSNDQQAATMGGSGSDSENDSGYHEFSPNRTKSTAQRNSEGAYESRENSLYSQSNARESNFSNTSDVHAQDRISA